MYYITITPKSFYQLDETISYATEILAKDLGPHVEWAIEFAKSRDTEEIQHTVSVHKHVAKVPHIVTVGNLTIETGCEDF